MSNSFSHRNIPHPRDKRSQYFENQNQNNNNTNNKNNYLNHTDNHFYKKGESNLNSYHKISYNTSNKKNDDYFSTYHSIYNKMIQHNIIVII